MWVLLLHCYNCVWLFQSLARTELWLNRNSCHHFHKRYTKIWRERGSSTSGDHHCYCSWFLMWRVIRFSSLLSIRPWKQMGNLPTLSLLVLENLKVRPGQAWYGKCLGMGAARSRLEWCSSWMTAGTWSTWQKDYRGCRNEFRLCLSGKSRRHTGGKYFKTQARMSIKILHWRDFNLMLCGLNFWFRAVTQGLIKLEFGSPKDDSYLFSEPDKSLPWIWKSLMILRNFRADHWRNFLGLVEPQS